MEFDLDGADKPFTDKNVLRSEAHRLFDKLWDSSKERDQEYEWLAGELGIPKQDCHFRMMGVQTLRRAIDILEGRLDDGI